MPPSSHHEPAREKLAQGSVPMSRPSHPLSLVFRSDCDSALLALLLSLTLFVVVEDQVLYRVVSCRVVLCLVLSCCVSAVITGSDGQRDSGES